MKAHIVYTRCGKQPIEVHHRLTRSRGGSVLDDEGETYHLMCLCREHHQYAHETSTPYDSGLMIEGYVTHEQGRVHYVGPNNYLRAKYGRNI